MKEKNQKFICRLFSGKCESAKDLLRAHRLFKNKNFESQVHKYLDEEWELFMKEDTDYVNPNGWEELYAKTKRSAGIDRKSWPVMKIAASAAILILSVLGIFFSKNILLEPKTTAMKEIKVEFGETAEVLLSDGTLVKLNGGSILKYPSEITESNRTVFVDGEAYFSQRKMGQPIFITTSHLAAAVTGESFVVSAYQEDPMVNIALEGSEGNIQSVVPMTRLSPAMSTKKLDSIEKSHRDRVEEKSTELALDHRSVRFLKNDQVVERFDGETVREFFAWKDGLVLFKNAKLDHVQRIFERTFAMQLQLEGCLKDQQTFTGQFDRKSIDQLLSHLARDFNAEYKFLGERKAVLKGNCK